MIRTVISLDPEDKRWLEQKSKETQKPMAALIRQAIRRMRQEDESNSPSFDTLLEQTQGLWKKEEGLAYQQSMRSEW
jgi:predicted DNA-binding protein